TGSPASRLATYRRTVLGSTPANAAAEWAQPVASNASRISMISLSDFFNSPSGGSARAWSETSSEAPEGPLASDRHTGPQHLRKGRSAVHRKGNDASAYKDLGLSAVNATLRQVRAASGLRVIRLAIGQSVLKRWLV